MGNNNKLPKPTEWVMVKVGRKEQGLPLPILFYAKISKWVMVMVNQMGRPNTWLFFQ